MRATGAGSGARLAAALPYLPETALSRFADDVALFGAVILAGEPAPR